MIFENITNRIRQAFGIPLRSTNVLEEMARVGYMSPKFEVYVYTDDPGYIPHVHVRDTNTKGKEFETCVRLDMPNYFLHGKRQDKFNASQKCDFAMFMEAPCRNTKFANNYEFAVDMWNANNSQQNIILQYYRNGDPIMPDYRDLE